MDLSNANQTCPGTCRISLIFQEQIQSPKNGPVARFDGLGCYQTRSEKPSRPARLAVFPEAAAQRQRRPNGANRQQRSSRKEPDSGGACAPNFTPVAHFSGANSSPEKRPCRTVWRALLLSNEERNQRWFSESGSRAGCLLANRACAGFCVCSSRRRMGAGRPRSGQSRRHWPAMGRRAVAGR